jgi:hypothetical protein
MQVARMQVARLQAAVCSELAPLDPAPMSECFLQPYGLKLGGGFFYRPRLTGTALALPEDMATQTETRNATADSYEEDGQDFALRVRANSEEAEDMSAAVELPIKVWCNILSCVLTGQGAWTAIRSVCRNFRLISAEPDATTLNIPVHTTPDAPSVGELATWTWRVEFQTRGTPHAHVLLFHTA